MTSSSICDYVTLFIEDGNIAAEDGTGRWYVPNSAYYYQNRGNLALMSIVDCGYTHGDINHDVLIGTTKAYNGSIAQVNSSDVIVRNDISILASIKRTAHALSGGGDDSDIITVFNNVEPIKVLTAARPSQIELVFIKDSKRYHTLTTSGFVVVKFEYLSPEEEQKITQEVSYNEAFPTKGF